MAQASDEQGQWMIRYQLLPVGDGGGQHVQIGTLWC